MTKKEIKELVAISDCPEIQKLWRPKVGDETQHGIVIKIYPKPADLIETTTYILSFNKHNLTWLPREGDCIRLMGDKFIKLEKFTPTNSYVCWRTAKMFDEKDINYHQDKSARIACNKALKATLEGG